MYVLSCISKYSCIVIYFNILINFHICYKLESFYSCSFNIYQLFTIAKREFQFNVVNLQENNRSINFNNFISILIKNSLYFTLIKKIVKNKLWCYWLNSNSTLSFAIYVLNLDHKCLMEENKQQRNKFKNTLKIFFNKHK